MKVTLGADIEGFVQDSSGDLLPVTGLVGGTKKNPKPLKIGYIQEDNVCAEFNIPVANNPAQFAQYVQLMKAATEEALNDTGNVLHIASAIRFPIEMLTSEPSLMQFGCDPDFNAWTGYENDPPDPFLDPMLRSSGFHLHVGYHRLLETPFAIRYIQLLDLAVGVPSLKFDPALPRRSLYGKAGAYRVKPYGVEWRVPGGAWLANPDKWEELGVVAIALLKFLEEHADKAVKKLERLSRFVPTVLNEGMDCKEYVILRKEMERFKEVPCLT
jgi:hypothetical protein